MQTIFRKAVASWWRKVKRYWWLLIPWAVWELIKDRVAEWANAQIDLGAPMILDQALYIARWAAGTTLGATLSTILVGLALLFVHSYWHAWSRDGRSAREGPASPPPPEHCGITVEPAVAIGGPDYAEWAKLETLELSEAACLWVGVEPDWPVPSKAKVQLQILIRAAESGKLHAELSSIERINLSVAATIGGRTAGEVIMPKTRCTRAALRAFSAEIGENPAFLQIDAPVPAVTMPELPKEPTRPDVIIREAVEIICGICGFAGDDRLNRGIDELRQAAAFGDIQLWGRRARGFGIDEAIGYGGRPLMPIPQNYWDRADFDVLHCLFTDNCRTESDESNPPAEFQVYQDVQANKAQLEEHWKGKRPVVEKAPRGQWDEGRFIFQEPIQVFSKLVTPSYNETIFHIRAKFVPPAALVRYKIEIDARHGRTKAQMTLNPHGPPMVNWQAITGDPLQTGEIRVDEKGTIYLATYSLPDTDPTIVRVSLVWWQENDSHA